MPATLAVLMVGLAVGVLLRRRLASAGYRLPDENALPARRAWWLVPAVGLVGALLWAAVVQSESAYIAGVFAVAGWVMVALAFIDLDVHRLPDAIQLPSIPILLVLLTIGAVVGDHWSWLLRAVAAGIALFAFYFVLLLLPSGFGFGDVKLAGLLGLLLGWLDWATVIRATFATFIVGGVVAIGLMLRGRGRDSEFAYGPSMLAGAVIAIVVSALVG